MTKRKLFLIIALFLIILTGFRILWVMISPHTTQPPLINGVLDLRDQNLNPDKLLILNGQWEFYPGMLLPSFNEQSLTSAPTKYIQVPGNWKDALSDSDSDKSAYGYGSYRLRVLTDNNKKQSYSLLISGARSSSEVYINGERLGSSGTPAENKEHYIPYILPYSVSFTTDKSEIEIVIHVANYSFSQTGEFLKRLYLAAKKL